MDRQKIVLLSLEEEFGRAETISDKISSARGKLIAKLEQATDLMEFTADDVKDVKTTEAMMNVMSTALSALKDEETAAYKRVSAKTKLKEAEQNQDRDDAIIKLISHVTSLSVDPDEDIELPDESTLELPPELLSTISKDELRADPDDLTS